MATIARYGTPSICTALPEQNNQYPGMLAGEALESFAVVELHEDGMVYKATDVKKAFGVAARKAAIGDAITVYRNVKAHYGKGLTPGTAVYLSATAGELDDADSTGAAPAIGRVISDSVIAFTAF